MSPAESRIGAIWRGDELDAIVADYFAMLENDLSGRPYSKAEHRRRLLSRLNRTKGSVEYKHQNISAVLEELGMPWIPGYKPAANYQEAIFGAIERHLVRHPDVLERPPAPPAETMAPRDVFVPPPTGGGSRPVPDGLQRLIRKFDPVARDHRNRALGRAGEEFVVGLERRLLAEAGRFDLARKVRWVSAEDGDGAGYDILSFTPHGAERLLEVKTTCGSARTPFFLTRNEHGLSLERPDHWRLYRVHQFAGSPRIFEITPPLDRVAKLDPEVWRVRPGSSIARESS